MGTLGRSQLCSWRLWLLLMLTEGHVHMCASSYHPVQENLVKSKGWVEVPAQNYLSVILVSLALPLW